MLFDFKFGRLDEIPTELMIAIDLAKVAISYLFNNTVQGLLFKPKVK